MENTGNFTTKIIPLLDEKAKWYDTEELPRLLEGYRLLHACVKTLFDFLVKKSLITPDPYKLDKKINDIKAPDSKQFVETERSVVMGQRFSDYETIGGLFMDATKGSVELTLTERIWDMILEIVREIAECFNIEDEQILDMLVNRSDKLSHFIEIYQLKLAS